MSGTQTRSVSKAPFGGPAFSIVTSILYAYRFYTIPAVLLVFILSQRWSLAAWVADQVALCLTGAAVAPITASQSEDINFWGGAFIGSAAVIIFTWIVVTNKAWQDVLLKHMDATPFQKTMFKHFFMQSLENAVFLFTMRQVVVFSAWLVVPPAVRAADTSGWDLGEAARYWVDGKLASVVYIVTSLTWYGVNVNLYQRPIEPMGYKVVTYALKACVYFGVAVVRIYPLLNAHHVSVITFLWKLVSQYPLVALALGAAAVEPADYIGRRVRAKWGITIGSIACINAANVFVMLWSSVAGRFMAELMLSE